MDRTWKVAVVGATGVVGRELLAAIAESGHPAEKTSALGSERSEATELDFGAETLEVERATPAAFRGHQIVFLATPADASRTLASVAQAAGAWVVDLSRAFVGDLSVPLVFPELPGGSLNRPFRGRVVRVPGAVTAALVRVLEPLREAPGIASVHVTALLGASSAGVRGVRELEEQTASLLSARDVPPTHFPHRLAFNLIPQVGPFSEGSGSTLEELAWRAETALLWGADAPVLDGTAVQVPTFFGHGLVLQVRTRAPIAPAEARERLARAPGLKLLDVPAEKVYPMPMLVSADPAVLVGRIRASAARPDVLELFAAIDNAGAGAARLALDAAELLAGRAVTN